MNLGIVLFTTTSSALRAEKVIQKAGLKVKLVPTPRELSSDCGIALLFDLADREAIDRVLAGAGVEGNFHILKAK